jgi:hypothetical protein
MSYVPIIYLSGLTSNGKVGSIYDADADSSPRSPTDCSSRSVLAESQSVISKRRIVYQITRIDISAPAMFP